MGGFYTDQIHGENMPSDALEITRDDHAALFVAQSAGKVIRPGQTGRPVAVDPPDPGDEELARRARGKRDALLSSSDWTQLPDVASGLATAYQSYRQALRDITAQAGFPRAIEWPYSPGDA